MDTEIKSKIYLEIFPGPLGRRMAEQVDDDIVNNEWPKSELVYGFAMWDETTEGYEFWSAIKNLFYRESIEESEIKKVFNRHNIEYL